MTTILWPTPVAAPVEAARTEAVTERDPRWVRPAVAVLLAGTGLLYLWGLGASGWANTYYSAAVQAGAHSWKAFLFGSADASNFITVDKTPASLWVMELSARMFGVNAWSILVPQALEGVAAVGVLYATVRRWFGPTAGLLSGAVLALTPVSALVFRFNNPDALLVLLLTTSAYTMTRALEDGRTRWLVLTGMCIGFAFLTKELQAFLVLPGYALVYLLAGPPRFARRFGQLCALGAAMIVAGGWWVALVQLTPASARPYIGGSQNNSFWNVLFGYNGFGRLTGNENGSVGGNGPAGSRWGPTGLTRMFNSSFGGEISWLLPAALLLLVAGLVVTALRPRTDRGRAALVLWGSWLVVTGIAFSMGRGIIHEYYTIALAPAIGALIGIGSTLLWRAPGRVLSALARVALGFILAITATWSYVLLHRAPAWHPALRTFALLGGIVVGLAIAITPWLRGRIAAAIAIVAVVIGLTGSAAWTLSTASRPHTGAIPLSGPASAQRSQAPRFGAFRGNGFGPPAFGRFGNSNPFANGAPPQFGGGGPPTGGAGGLGGLLNGSKPGAEITSLLKNGASGYRWVAATVGANNAAGYQLASNEPIMAIGGFNGTDPTPTLAQFESLVAQHKVHYFIASGRGGGGGGGFAPGGGGPAVSSASSSIESWVTSHFNAQTINGVTVYDLTPAR
jgi:4-amino-4-deoxy-L-arabinose transferase-like glycosyltransferase